MGRNLLPHRLSPGRVQLGLILAFCIFLLFSAGCKKFLNVRPDTNNINPTTIGDFEEMLNNDSLALCNSLLADVVSDDVQMSDATLSGDTSWSYAHAYLWAPAIWNPGDRDLTYNSSYSRILQLNIVLDRIDAAQGGAQEKNRVRAQARINRAWYYLQLANLYGADYQATTASTDLAVPLVLLADANQRPARATVQQVYVQILQDLNAAVTSPDLPGMGQDIIHPGKAAGFALLAKTYLYMARYQDALSAADAALTINNTLWDYNTSYIMPAGLIDLSKNPEILLARLCVDNSFYLKFYSPLLISQTLRSVLDSNDCRLVRKFGAVGDYNVSPSSFSAQIFDYSVGVPEVMLIKAECLARQGDAAGALALVNQLRRNRLINYVPLSDTADALTAVLQERRRELFYHGGSRLFDLKRLNRDSRFAQTLQRVADDSVTILATLSPNSPRYLMSFSPVLIANNPSIVQNNR
jgi:tetratricopeptide (TPR) repeat protein